MIKITYPDIKPAIKRIEDTDKVFCLIRRKWFVLTPEEWVRQNFLLYLTDVLQYPRKLISVEKEIKLSELKKRFDIVVYDQNAQPEIIIECKEMNEKLTDEVLNQVLRYNIKIRAKRVVITNGSNTIAFENIDGRIVELNNLERKIP
jgi:hypothetical protein